MVWCGYWSKLKEPKVRKSKAISADANLTANGKREGRPHLSEAKERATGLLVQMVYFLKWTKPVKDASIGKDRRWTYQFNYRTFQIMTIFER